jgi:alpha-galactosidase
MNEETKNILTNREVIALNQDSLGIQCFRYDSKDSLEIWVKPLMHDEWAICFLNRSMKAKKIEFDWANNMIKDDIFKKELNSNKVTYKVRDLWANKDLGNTKKKLMREIMSHDILLVRLTRK